MSIPLGLTPAYESRAKISTPAPEQAVGTARSISHALASVLLEHGVTRVFGVTGGGIARFVSAAAETGLEIIHARHEGGAAFMASEASIASSVPGVIYTTSGPGLTNVLTGVIGGAWEGAQLIVVTGGTRRESVGRGAFQETGSRAIERMSLFPPSLPHHAVTINSSKDLDEVATLLELLTAQPGGFVVQVLIPNDVQSRHYRKTPPKLRETAPLADEPAFSETFAAIGQANTMLWVGFGARRSAAAVRQLAAHLQCPVMATPRGKGTFPERHPQYVGVTGFGGHPSVYQALERERPETIIVLGSRLGEFASYWQEHFSSRATLIHVDIDAEVFGQAFPEATTIGVQTNIETFVARTLTSLPQRLPHRLTPARVFEPPALTTNGTRGPIHPRDLFAAVQRHVVDNSQAILLAEAGNAFAWAGHTLAFDTPRYRASTTFGSMGHASAGVVGVALHRRERTVAIVGDGAMLMNNELSTAAEHGAACLWIVLNDAAYGMIRHGMHAIGLRPVATSIPRVDFVAFAQAQGVPGRAVNDASQLDAALAHAMAQTGPYLLDINIDPTVVPPFEGRNDQLQTAESSGEWRMILEE